MSLNEQLRQLPGVDQVAQRLRGLESLYPRALIVEAIRDSLHAVREQLRAGEEPDDSAEHSIEAQVRSRLTRWTEPSLRPVINATGVILHTNLGRAPLPSLSAIDGYSNLEYDLATGRRGKRDVHIAHWIERLTGKPGIAVNNNAAAVYLVLNELAAGAEVVVSRGELIEIGDGFRIPDIMQRAGVILREVGTTNRTRIEDYRAALTDRTRLLLKVHPSNFRISGFTAQTTGAELAALGREHGIPVYEDLGSGCLTDLAAAGVNEPLVRDSLNDGINVVSFSGDKLMGGPQAGIIAGDPALISRIRRNPMFRALRLDKVMLQYLETTLRHFVFEEWEAIPTLRMIRMSAQAIRARAVALLERLNHVPATIIDGESMIGGGSTPEQPLPTALIAIPVANPELWGSLLREHTPPVITRISEGRLLLDLRTVFPEQEAALIHAIGSAAFDSQ